MVTGKINAMKNKSIIFFLFFYLFFYINNYLHPMSFGDDYLYAFIWEGNPMFVPLSENAVRVSSLSDLVKSQWLLYMTWGGRVVGQTLTQFFIWLGKDVFNFFNALASTLLIAEIYWCANKGKITFTFDARRLCFIFFSLWAFTPGFNPVFLWLTCACIYVWPAMFLLAFLLPYIKKFYNFHIKIGSGIAYNVSIFVLGIIAGCGNENVVCWIIVGLLLFLFLYRKCRCKETWLYLGVAGLMTGYAILMLAPGNMARMTAEHGTNWLTRNLLETNFSMLMAVLTFQFILWYFSLKSLYILKKEKTNWRIINKDRFLVSAFCMVSFLMSATMMLSPFFPARSGFHGTILLIIACAILLRLQNEKEVVLVPKPARGFLFIVGVIYFITTSCVSIRHSYYIDLEMKEIINQARQLRASSSNEVLIVKPLKESDKLTDMLSGFHISSFGLSDDMNNWCNVAFARYYSIKGIKLSK